MDSLLVTGGAGFIGSNFIRYVLNQRQGIQLVNLDKLTYAGNLENLKDVEQNQNYNFVKGSINNSNLLEYLFRQYEFDSVVNFAAESHVDRSILGAEDFIETNVKGTQKLLEVAKKFEVKKFVQISTDEVYGELGDEGTFSEENPLTPNSPYSASKASADHLCQAYFETHGLPVVITRSSNNYGPYQFPEKLIPLMIYKAYNQEELPVYGDGTNVRDWIYVEDNCKAIFQVLDKGKPGEAYNIGGNQERQNIQVVKMILEGLGRSEDLIEFVEDRPGHDYRYALDISKINSKLGWEPNHKFEEGLEKTIDWYLSHLEWVQNCLDEEYQNYYDKNYGNAV